MRKTLDHLPNWAFELDEVSAGVYQVVATHVAGCRIEAKGTEPDDLMEQAAADAEKMDADLEGKKRP
jgi:hypothetical protein